MVKVDVPGNDLQWVAQGLDLVLSRCISEEVELDGAARFGFAHAVIVALADEQGEVFRGSLFSCIYGDCTKTRPALAPS